MNNNFDPIDDALNTSSEIEVSTVSENKLTKNDGKTEVRKDYEYTRGNLYSLIEKGQEALNGIMEVAEEQGSARAYEVAGQIIKSVADLSLIHI